MPETGSGRSFLSIVDTTVWLSAVLISGLVGVVPLLTLTGRALGEPFSHPIIVPFLGTAVVGVGYVAYVWSIKELRRGSIIAMICLSTFAANIPLTTGAQSYPGGLGPILWLFQLPLAVVVIFCIRERWWINGGGLRQHWPQVMFVAFTLWTLIPIIMGVAVRPLVALAFTLHVGVGCLVFIVVSAAVFRDILSLQDIVVTLTISALGHSVFTIFQLFNQSSFSITVLGETPLVYTQAVIADVQIGIYLSGFTGQAGNFATLLVLTAPIIMIFAISKYDWMHLFAAGLSVGFYTLIRLTEMDANRGGALITIVGILIAIILVQVQRLNRFKIMIRRTRMWGSGLLLSIISILILLTPSSISGNKSQSNQRVDNITSQSSGESGSQSSGDVEDSHIMVESVTDIVAGISLPVFDLSTLGIRAAQYAVAVVILFEHPLTGVGGGNFAYLGLDYGLPLLEGLGRTYAVHNAYLAILAETGIIGFLFFISVLASGLIAAARLARSQIIPQWVTIGSGCGLLGVYAVMFWNVSHVSVPNWIPMLVLIGALVGAHQRQYFEKS